MACFVITAVERLSSVSDVVQQPKLPCYYTVISSSHDLALTNTVATRNTFCRTQSLSTATFFDHVTFTQFKICCCVQNFMKSGWFFAEIWRYIDFQNGGRPPFWNCFTTIWNHPRSLCCWPQLPVKFHVNLIYRSEDIPIWSFRILGLKCPFRPQNGGFGDFGSLNVIIHHRDPQKAHPSVNPRLLSYQL